MNRVDGHRYRRDKPYPSFSSTLLDEIYRSIDEAHGRGCEEGLGAYRESARMKHCDAFSKEGNGYCRENPQSLDNIMRACLIEKWMDKKAAGKVAGHRNYSADSTMKSRLSCETLLHNSSSSSSDSSYGGGFSSSDGESLYGIPSMPKPIRTNVSAHQPQRFSSSEKNSVFSQQKPKSEGTLVKTKSRAMKIYGDLKKVKQPISPGGRLASFVNSLFTNARKTKKSSSGGYGDGEVMETKSKSAHASTCSSASSFSRSCLSKTPPSRGKLSNGTKRSVRFYPVSTIVGEDCQPCGQKSLYGEESKSQPVKIAMSSINEEIRLHLSEKNRRVEEPARELPKNYQKKNEREFDLTHNKFNSFEEKDDDAASYDSTDLFELDNLSGIGSGRYREELPVYETTRLDSSRAVANGFLS